MIPQGFMSCLKPVASAPPSEAYLVVPSIDSEGYMIYDTTTFLYKSSISPSNLGAITQGDPRTAAFHPLLGVLAYSDTTGDKVKFATEALGSDPWQEAGAIVFTQPDGTVRFLKFSNGVGLNDVYLAVCTDEPPYINIYNADGTNWTKISDPAVLPGDGTTCASFSPDNSLLAVTLAVSPYIIIYNTNDWSKITDPAVLPAGTGATFCTFTSDGNYLAVGSGASPYITIYNTNDWSKVTDPVVLPNSTVVGISSSPVGVGGPDLACRVEFTTPYIIAYDTSDWSATTTSDMDDAGVGITCGYTFSDTVLISTSATGTPLPSEGIVSFDTTTYDYDSAVNTQPTAIAGHICVWPETY